MRVTGCPNLVTLRSRYYQVQKLEFKIETDMATCYLLNKEFDTCIVISLPGSYPVLFVSGISDQFKGCTI